MKTIKQNHKLIIALTGLLLAVLWVGNLQNIPPAAEANSMANHPVGETEIPFPAVRDGVTTTTPYLFLERWGDGGPTGTTYNAGTGLATTTYADACIRFEQNSTTGTWYATIPPCWPSGSYLAWPRSGADGAEANTDTNLAPPQVINWDKGAGLKIALNNILVGY